MIQINKGNNMTIQPGKDGALVVQLTKRETRKVQVFFSKLVRALK